MQTFPVSVESFSPGLITLSFSDHVPLPCPHPFWVLQGMDMVVQQGTMRTGGSLGWQGRAWQTVLSYHLSQEQPGALGQPLSQHQAPPWGQGQA